MHTDIDNPQDDKTMLVEHPGAPSAHPSLTDFTPAPRVESLERRLVHTMPPPPNRAFVSGRNPLLDAAAELLSEVVRIKYSKTAEKLETLNQHLNEAVTQFQQCALADINEAQVSAASYVLCTVLDEAVTSTDWGEKDKWAQMSLLSTRHHETSGGERFFELLGRSMRDPIKHLPLLELMYLCLALGFEGKYRVEPRGALALESLRDDLYRQIRTLRGEESRELSPHWQGLREQRQAPVRLVPGWLVALFTLVCLGVMYAGFAWVLGEQRERVLQPYQPLDPAAVAPQS